MPAFRYASKAMVYLAAAVQLTTTDDPEHSLDAAETGIREAAKRGAKLIGLPEAVNLLDAEKKKLRLAEPLDGPSFQRLGKLAAELEIYLMAGSLPEISEDPDRPYNTSVLYGPKGERLGVYRKTHLFDIRISETEHYGESKNTRVGDRWVVVPTPLGRIGLSICYDLRFPELYRELRALEAEVVFVPAAFLTATGHAHWEVLLRARAIENQSYVIAPGQYGRHGKTRESFGHSLIVDPWGRVVAQASDRESPQVVISEIDLEMVHALWRKMPVFTHRRPELKAELSAAPGA